MISLANENQIVLGRAPDYDHVGHVAAQSPADLEAALRDSARPERHGRCHTGNRLTG